MKVNVYVMCIHTMQVVRRMRWWARTLRSVGGLLCTEEATCIRQT